MEPRSRLNTEDTVVCQEIEEQLEELQLEYEEKCGELVERENELKAVRMEVQELQTLLQANARPQRSSLVPQSMSAGSGVNGNPQAEELRRIFLWLAEHVVLDQSIQFNACCDLIMAGQHVRIREVVQWPMRTTDLRLTVPTELAPDITNLLAATKQNENALCEAKAKSIIDSWLLTTSEPLSETTSGVTLLTHRESQKSCLVANFPLPPPPPPQQFQQWAGVAVGDAVEVNFQGQWFRGTVKLIEEGGIASVHCDVDPPDVITKAPMNLLRRAESAAQSSTSPPPQPEGGGNPGLPQMPQPPACTAQGCQPPSEVANNPSVPKPVANNPTQPPPPADDIKKSFSHKRQAST